MDKSGWRFYVAFGSSLTFLPWSCLGFTFSVLVARRERMIEYMDWLIDSLAV